MEKNHYRADIRWSDEDGVFVARAPELDGVVTHGRSMAEAAKNLEEAVQLHLESLKAHDQEVPVPVSEMKLPGKYALRMGKDRHEDATIKARAKGVSLNEYINELIDRDQMLELRKSLKSNAGILHGKLKDAIEENQRTFGEQLRARATKRKKEFLEDMTSIARRENKKLSTRKSAR